MVAFSGFYESHEPPSLGDVRSIVPSHCNGHRNGQQSGYICSIIVVLIVALATARAIRSE
jgi:hypothetical protein